MGPMVAHAVLLALLSLPTSPLQLAVSGTVHGHIFDVETGQPLSSAVVTVVETGVEVRTGSDGSFRIDFLTPGSYSVKVRRRGYMSYRKRHVPVRSNRDAVLEIRMLKADDVFQLRRARLRVSEKVLAVVHARVGTPDRSGARVPTPGVLHRDARAVRG